MTYTLEQMKEHRRLWVQALRSGKYQQARGALHSRDRFCCLGVACLVAGKTTEEMGLRLNLDGFRDVMSFFGLNNVNGGFGKPETSMFGDEFTDCLAQRNDRGHPFEEIADIIESEPAGLFIDEVQS